jgi:hypothetical protein
MTTRYALGRRALSVVRTQGCVVNVLIFAGNCALVSLPPSWSDAVYFLVLREALHHARFKHRAHQSSYQHLVTLVQLFVIGNQR